jgi:hypothetical protein
MDKEVGRAEKAEIHERVRFPIETLLGWMERGVVTLLAGNVSD